MLRQLLEEVREMRAEQRGMRLLMAYQAAPAVPVEVAATMLGCSVRQVYNLLKSGKLKRAPRPGSKTLVTMESIQSALAPQGAREGDAAPSRKYQGRGAGNAPRPARQPPGALAAAIRALPLPY